MFSLDCGPLVDLLGPPHHVLVLVHGEELAGLKEFMVVLISVVFLCMYDLDVHVCTDSSMYRDRLKSMHQVA